MKYLTAVKLAGITKRAREKQIRESIIYNQTLDCDIIYKIGVQARQAAFKGEYSVIIDGKFPGNATVTEIKRLGFSISRIDEKGFSVNWNV